MSNALAPWPRLHLIYARARNGVIGLRGALPWHVPQDLAHFKRCTMAAPVIMGRKTWESLPERFRPLPGRSNIVLSRDPHWRAAGAQSACSLPQALQLCVPAPVAWVIGGAQLYEQALPLAAQVLVTEIQADYAGDAFAPRLDPAQWQETQRSPTQHTAEGIAFAFVTYARRSDGAQDAATQ